MKRQKITVTVEDNIIHKAKVRLEEIYGRQNISMCVEAYLRLVGDTGVNCVVCGKRIPYKDSTRGHLYSYLCPTHKSFMEKAPKELHNFAMYITQFLDRIHIKKTP